LREYNFYSSPPARTHRALARSDLEEDSHMQPQPVEVFTTSAIRPCNQNLSASKCSVYSPSMTEAERPKIGVGVIIHDNAGNIVMGERAGSHGAGTLQCPGGHLEYGESFAETAAREVLEETGLEVGNIKFLTATNDVFGEGKHYVTIFVTCTITGDNKTPMVSSRLS
jgi:ADP-ribose pyrophosphatase YjhB (NUDIX family)